MFTGPTHTGAPGPPPPGHALQASLLDWAGQRVPGLGATGQEGRGWSTHMHDAEPPGLPPLPTPARRAPESGPSLPGRTAEGCSAAHLITQETLGHHVRTAKLSVGEPHSRVPLRSLSSRPGRPDFRGTPVTWKIKKKLTVKGTWEETGLFWKTTWEIHH